MNYYLEVLKKYAVFNGRAQRKEYWMFLLFNMIISSAIIFVEIIIGITSRSGVGVLSALYGLAVLIPGIAVMVRRLHDTNHSGWWWLILFVPLVGVVIFTILMVRDSQIGENKYGLNPKGKTN